jgi:hypothetical protein
MGWRGFGFVHHSRAIFCRAVPNPNLTIRNFCIAVPGGPLLLLAAHGGAPRVHQLGLLPPLLAALPPLHLAPRLQPLPLRRPLRLLTLLPAPPLLALLERERERERVRESGVLEGERERERDRERERETERAAC